jgi:hypothetical protein
MAVEGMNGSRGGGKQQPKKYMNSSVVHVGELGSSIDVIPGFSARRCDRGGFKHEGRLRGAGAWVMTDQGHRAACVLAGVDEWGECIARIAASRICELLQFG